MHTLVSAATAAVNAQSFTPMFEIINDHEVRLMNRVYQYEGDKLVYEGESVENQYVQKQFSALQKTGWMDPILDIVSEKHDVIMDRWEYAIMQTVKQHNTDGFQFSHLIYSVCKILGASEDQAIAGVTYHPYTGKLIKNTIGWIATWIEERSPDSRQRYFMAGKRYNSTRPLLFVNDKLFEANTKCEWRPYSYVRGDVWRYDPAAAQARVQPEENTLAAAALLYRKQGMRGAKNRTVVTQDIAGTERVPNVARIAGGFMVALGAVAAIMP